MDLYRISVAGGQPERLTHHNNKRHASGADRSAHFPALDSSLRLGGSLLRYRNQRAVAKRINRLCPQEPLSFPSPIRRWMQTGAPVRSPAAREEARTNPILSTTPQ